MIIVPNVHVTKLTLRYFIKYTRTRRLPTISQAPLIAKGLSIAPASISPERPIIPITRNSKLNNSMSTTKGTSVAAALTTRSHLLSLPDIRTIGEAISRYAIGNRIE